MNTKRVELLELNRATFHMIAATIIDFLYLFAGFLKAAALATTMFATIGDSLARIAGVSFGKIRLFNIDKTLLGSTVFYFTGVGSAYLVGSMLGTRMLDPKRWRKACPIRA